MRSHTARGTAITVVVDHETGRLVWAAEGRNPDTLGKFFDQLGAARATLLIHVGCDGAQRIHSLVGGAAEAARLYAQPMDTEQVRSFANTLLEVDSAGTAATARHRRERANGIVKLWTFSPLPTA